MTERRPWTQEQDKALIYLKDTLQVKKWSQIAKKLEFQFNLPGRNGKQCRQRYTNHLDSSIISNQFTSEEEQKLFLLHDKIGNKWSHISKQFKGRTDNLIKNHFHSKLRKSIRKLNKQIKISFKKTKKPYKLSIIYKIVEASDYRFYENIKLTQENFKFFNELKNALLQYAGGNVQKTQLSLMKQKDQAQFITSQLQNFQKLLKAVVLDLPKSQIYKKQNGISLAKRHRKNSSSNTQNASSQFTLNFDQIQDQNESIYEEVSFQFIDQMNQHIPNLKLTQDDSTNSNHSEKQINSDIQLFEDNKKANNFYSFQKLKKQYQQQKFKKQNVLKSLIQQFDFSNISIENRFSIKSFESLKEFEESYLNQSEVSMLMKKYDDNSCIDIGLFQ